MRSTMDEIRRFSILGAVCAAVMISVGTFSFNRHNRAEADRIEACEHSYAELQRLKDLDRNFIVRELPQTREEARRLLISEQEVAIAMVWIHHEISGLNRGNEFDNLSLNPSDPEVLYFSLEGVEGLTLNSILSSLLLRREIKSEDEWLNPNEVTAELWKARLNGLEVFDMISSQFEHTYQRICGDL